MNDQLAESYESAPLLDIHDGKPRPTITASWTQAPPTSTLLRRIESTSELQGEGS